MEYSAKNTYMMGIYVCSLATSDPERKKKAENIQSVLYKHLYEGLIKDYNTSNFGDELSFDCYNRVDTPDLQYVFSGCYRIDTVSDLFYEKVDPMSECTDSNLHGIEVRAVSIISTSSTKKTNSRELLECYIDLYPIAVRVLCSGIKLYKFSDDKTKTVVFDSTSK